MDLSLLPALSLPGSIAFGLFARGLGLVHFISFLSIASQILALAGSSGVTPFRATMRSVGADFPSAKQRLLHFPSLFWLTGTSDVALVLVPLAGAACGLCACLGLQAPLARVGCWVCMRSLDLPVGLLYPWDSLLLESGWLAVLLPDAPPLWRPTMAATASLLAPAGSAPLWPALVASAGLSAAPHPWLAFAVRWLLARLMLGFGKKKFVGTSLHHSCYIKSFLVAQPIPTALGWLASRLPLALFQFALLVMFLVECVAPWLLLLAGSELRAYAAASIALLMLGIQAGGNFGYFNLLAVSLCLACLDVDSSLLDAPPPVWPATSAASAASVASGAVAELGLRLLLGTHAALSLVFLPFDSWCTNAFGYWPQLAIARKPAVRGLLRLCRFFADQRLLHAYGVFPPASNPPVRMVTLLEGSHDGVHWRRYHWRWLPCSRRSVPPFVAPHHPRLDHSLFYASFGTSPDNFLGTINSARPYAFGPQSSTLHRLAHRLLTGASTPVRRLFGSDPFPPSGPPPRFVRARLMAYEPTALRHLLRTGEFWTEACLDVHLPTLALEVEGGGGGGTGAQAGGAQADGAQADGADASDRAQGSVRSKRAPSQRRVARSPPRSQSKGGDRGGDKDGDKDGGASGGASGAVTVSRPPSCLARHPLLFHPDLMPVWRTRVPTLRGLLAADLDGSSSSTPEGGAPRYAARRYAALCLADEKEDALGGSRSVADAFWDAFVPFVAAECRMAQWADSKGGLPARCALLESRFSPGQMLGFEKILGGLTLRMMPVLEAMHMEGALPLTGGRGLERDCAPSYFHLVLAVHLVVLTDEALCGALLRTTATPDAKDGRDGKDGPHGREGREARCELARKAVLAEVLDLGFGLYGALHCEALLAHARKHFVAHEMMRRYSPAPTPQHPCLIPGFLHLQPLVAEALKPLVCGAQSFPLWKPPPKLGDWERVADGRSHKNE